MGDWGCGEGQNESKNYIYTWHTKKKKRLSWDAYALENQENSAAMTPKSETQGEATLKRLVKNTIFAHEMDICPYLWS